MQYTSPQPVLVGINNKTQSQVLGGKAERSAKQSSQPLESSDLYEIFRLKRASSHLIFLPSAAIKSVHHHCLVSMAN